MTQFRVLPAREWQHIRAAIERPLSIFALMMSFTLGAWCTANGAESPVAGWWLGTLRVNAVELRLGMELRSAGQSLQGTLYSIDQASVTPFDTASFSEGVLVAKSNTLGVTFCGTIDLAADQISGTFTQSKVELPLILKHVDRLPVMQRLQTPVPPLPYVEEEVTYQTNGGRTTISGTLAMPKAATGRVPAVLLLSGSGNHDRDETILGHRPFHILADAFARNGIAVLRTDSRGVGKSTSPTIDATLEEFAEDALSGVSHLASLTEIDPTRIGLLGHSEGGLVAMIAAKQSNRIAFAILLATPTLNGEKTLSGQSKALGTAYGASQESMGHSAALNRQLFAIAKNADNPTEALAQLLKCVEDYERALPDDDRHEFAEARPLIDGQLATLVTRRFRSFLAFEPTTALSKISCPLLFLYGSNDLQVPPTDHIAVITDLRSRNHLANFTVHLLENLNHLFQTSKTGLPAEYGHIPETISTVALNTIATWCDSHVKR
jgi:pimeloyl-ACP methyl ester carboxylesterase